MRIGSMIISVIILMHRRVIQAERDDDEDEEDEAEEEDDEKNDEDDDNNDESELHLGFETVWGARPMKARAVQTRASGRNLAVASPLRVTGGPRTLPQVSRRKSNVGKGVQDWS